jgi:hypothetical protein
MDKPTDNINVAVENLSNLNKENGDAYDHIAVILHDTKEVLEKSDSVVAQAKDLINSLHEYESFIKDRFKF